MPRVGLRIAPWKHLQPVTLALPKVGNPGGSLSLTKNHGSPMSLSKKKGVKTV